jgi:hypothetical protein
MPALHCTLQIFSCVYPGCFYVRVFFKQYWNILLACFAYPPNEADTTNCFEGGNPATLISQSGHRN